MDDYIVKSSLVSSLTGFIPKTSIPILDVMLYTLLTGFIYRLFTYATTLENFNSIWIYLRNPLRLLFNENIITITHLINLDDRDDYDDDDDDKNLNNLIVIRAIRMLAKGGKSYKLRNISEKDDYTNEYEREKQKTVQLQLDDVLYDEDIKIDFWEETKKRKTQVGNNVMEIEKRDSMTLQLSSSKRSVEYIRDYIKRKRDEYIDMTCAHENNIKVWMADEYKESCIRFAPYKFVGTKCWDSYFVPNKKKIREVVDNFKNRTGVYDIPGAQHKLGLLLHGVPGCGKSSLIKVLAKYLDRHVIIVDIGKILTTRSLTKIFHDEYIFNGEENTYKYVPLDKRIIVFEEIDTSGSVVMDREKLQAQKEKDEEKFRSMFGKYEFYDVMYKAQQSWKSHQSTPSSTQTDLNGTQCNTVSIEEGDGGDGGGTDGTEDNFKSIPYRGENMKDYTLNTLKKNEKISLGDLLNLFDGLMELNGLVYVMTTNHREFLDKALTRPGRVTLDIEFHEMEEPEIRELLTFYYDKYNIHNEALSKEEKGHMIDVISKKANKKYKASMLEVMCQSNTLREIYDTILNEVDVDVLETNKD